MEFKGIMRYILNHHFYVIAVIIFKESLSKITLTSEMALSEDSTAERVIVGVKSIFIALNVYSLVSNL